MSTSDTPSSERSTAPSTTDRVYRMLGTVAIVSIAFIGGLLVVLTGGADGSVVEAAEPGDGDTSGMHSGVGPSRMVLGHLKLRDTVYTTDSVYLEVNLTKQNVTVHRRGEDPATFLVSSGNPYIREGMSTPMGVFTVQNMTPMALSKQFNNARLHNWIGVQGGVGFHGLDGSGYYGYLGVRPSSHGCLRMAREAIKTMYSMVHPGALIMVHGGDPARVVAFCEPRDTAGATLIDSASVFNRALGRERLTTLMEGRALLEPQPRLVHLAKQRLRWGMEIGRAARIPRQRLPETFSLAGADAILAAGVADVADRPMLGRWRADALRRAEEHVRSERTAWRKEGEPAYGN
ncbi:MAG TPA: L,D-transpeptidase [Candidatus Kapabacteria bacterium]|nr:L,D-transpeptidase [Candidatus Kapabacteria bacterium]